MSYSPGGDHKEMKEDIEHLEGDYHVHTTADYERNVNAR
jgi:hypothetical protein